VEAAARAADAGRSSPQALVGVLVDEQDGHVFAARVLVQAAIEVADGSDEGTRAARVALLRCVAGFLLHDRGSRRAAALRHETEAGV